MNKILNVNIKDDTMTFLIYTDISIVNTNDIRLYIDESSNIAGMYCDSADNHDYVLNYSNTIFTFKEVVRLGETKEVTTQYTYELSAQSAIIRLFDTNMKYIKMYCTTEQYANDYVDGIYYDPTVIYNAEMSMIRKYCSTCLDDKLMQLIMLIVFKRQLLELAIATSHNKEAMQAYLDLAKLLSVSISTNTVKTGCLECVNSSCSGCVNGICKI